MALFRVRRLSALAVAGVVLFALSACQPAPNTYVALGDSYTAGPLIANQSTSPLGCLRSDHNYPSLIAPTLPTTVFKDVSCSGAETGDFFAAQDVTPGPANPPQLDAVDANTRVVTIGIGGNDIGFSGIVENCVNLNPFGTPCKGDYQTASGDTLTQKINATAPKIAAVVAAAHQHNATAKVFLIGYPDILPNTGNGCWPLVPILPPDVVYLRGIEQQLNAMLASVAAANHATFVDTYTGTIGHDVCSSDNWINGVVPTSVSAPVHPNAAGMQAIANIVGPVVKAGL